MTRKNAAPNTNLTLPVSPETMWRMTALARFWFSPIYLGLENVRKERPCLYVGNHTIYGVLDIPLYMARLYRDKGVVLRGLGDHFHYRVPLWREFVTQFGSVHGTPENCDALMDAGEHVMVFPGGGREVCKRKGEAYKLVWKNRTGFARLAIAHGYPILPMASVGPDNAYTILLDADDFLESLPGRLATSFGPVRRLLRDGEAVPPIARGIGPTLIPRPERFYFSFGRPIPTRAYRGRENDPDALMELRKKVEDSIHQQMGRLLLLREQDTDKGLLRRILTRL